MNNFFLLLILFITLLTGCICAPGCEFYALQNYRIENTQWQYKKNEILSIPFKFYTNHTKAKNKRICIGYYKEKCEPGVSDDIMNDSTKILCNKTLRNNTSVYPANSNLLNYQELDQTIFIPAKIYSKEDGNYLLNLNSLTFNMQDLTSPYIFTIQIKTNKKIYSDTTIITLLP